LVGSQFHPKVINRFISFHSKVINKFTFSCPKVINMFTHSALRLSTDSAFLSRDGYLPEQFHLWNPLGRRLDRPQNVPDIGDKVKILPVWEPSTGHPASSL
jgi:hypothetical protein